MHSISDFLSHLLNADGSMSIWHAFGAVVLAYFGGVLSSLTPCVYPMIPITVSVIGGIGSRPGEAPKTRRWHEVWTKGASYVGGMTVVYSFLGVLAGLTGKVFGSLTNNSTWYLGLGVVMTFAALIMLDLIVFDPIVWWEGMKRRFGRAKPPSAAALAHERREVSLVGAFVLGASSGFIAAPCTTPVLTSILAYIAKTQSVLFGLSLMFGFSLGLGTLLLVVAAFAGAVQVMPRSGMWMKKIKAASGLILLAFAEYLIYRAGVFGGNR